MYLDFSGANWGDTVTCNTVTAKFWFVTSAGDWDGANAITPNQGSSWQVTTRFTLPPEP
jgi:hypothetical protein